MAKIESPANDQTDKGNHVGIVTAVRPRGQPYVVVSVEGVEGSITFTLTPDVWHEDEDPHVKDKVLLRDVKDTEHGWRASSASFKRL